MNTHWCDTQFRVVPSRLWMFGCQVGRCAHHKCFPPCVRRKLKTTRVGGRIIFGFYACHQLFLHHSKATFDVWEGRHQSTRKHASKCVLPKAKACHQRIQNDQTTWSKQVPPICVCGYKTIHTILLLTPIMIDMKVPSLLCQMISVQQAGK